MSKQKEQAGLNVILEAYSANENNAFHSVVMFANHHLEELDSETLSSLTGQTKPEPKALLSKLYLSNSWNDDETGDTNMDFKLPNDISDYLICIKYNKDGDIVDIDMES